MTNSTAANLWALYDLATEAEAAAGAAARRAEGAERAAAYCASQAAVAKGTLALFWQEEADHSARLAADAVAEAAAARAANDAAWAAVCTAEASFRALTP